MIQLTIRSWGSFSLVSVSTILKTAICYSIRPARMGMGYFARPPKPVGAYFAYRNLNGAERLTN
jgi:hypothetical protein